MKRENILAMADNYMNRYAEDYPFTKDTIFAAFVEGASRMNYEHARVWHNASEYPSKVGAILYQTTLGQFRTVCHGTSGEDIWKVFAKDYGVARWAYISDLLPKGGEL